MEQGKEDIKYEKALILARYFNISVPEIYSGKRIENITVEESSEITNNVVKNTNKKYKKKILVISCISIISIILLYLLYYFLNSFNSIKVYKVYGENENFKTSDGLMLITKDEIYFNFSVFSKNEEEIKNIALLYEKDDELIQITKTDSQCLFLIDFYGYESYFKYEDIISAKGRLIIEVEKQDSKERIVLTIDKMYENRNLFFLKEIKVAQGKSVSEKNKAPETIKKLFQEEDGIYYYKIYEDRKEIAMSYNTDVNLFIVAESINHKFTSWTYYIDLDELGYTFVENDKVTKQGEINLISIRKEEIELYNYFNDNYIKKYLN